MSAVSLRRIHRSAEDMSRDAVPNRVGQLNEVNGRAWRTLEGFQASAVVQSPEEGYERLCHSRHIMTGVSMCAGVGLQSILPCIPVEASLAGRVGVWGMGILFSCLGSTLAADKLRERIDWRDINAKCEAYLEEAQNTGSAVQEYILDAYRFKETVRKNPDALGLADTLIRWVSKEGTEFPLEQFFTEESEVVAQAKRDVLSSLLGFMQENKESIAGLEQVRTADKQLTWLQEHFSEDKLLQAEQSFSEGVRIYDEVIAPVWEVDKTDVRAKIDNFRSHELPPWKPSCICNRAYTCEDLTGLGIHAAGVGTTTIASGVSLCSTPILSVQATVLGLGAVAVMVGCIKHHYHVVNIQAPVLKDREFKHHYNNVRFINQHTEPVSNAVDEIQNHVDSLLSVRQLRGPREEISEMFRGIEERSLTRFRESLDGSIREEELGEHIEQMRSLIRELDYKIAPVEISSLGEERERLKNLYSSWTERVPRLQQEYPEVANFITQILESESMIWLKS